jgi:hypothetical protein
VLTPWPCGSLYWELWVTSGHPEYFLFSPNFPSPWELPYMSPGTAGELVTTEYSVSHKEPQDPELLCEPESQNLSNVRIHI